MFVSTLMASAIASHAANLTPCFVEGSEAAVACTMLSVPRHYTSTQNESAQSPLTKQGVASDDTVQIHVIKAASLAESNHPPVFVLAGGPGQAATEMTYTLRREFRDIRKQHDVIYIAQRGSGLSNGQRCDAHSATSNAEIQQAFEQCYEQVMELEQQLSTHTLAQDIETTRKALGYDKITLWGGSYGTYAAQHYASYYPENVNALILDAVVGLNDSPLVMGGQYPQQSLDRLDVICQQDNDCARLFPQWKQHFYELLDSLENDALTVSVDGEPVAMDQTSVMHMARTVLYSPKAAAKLPLAIENAYRGDTRLLGALNTMIGGAATNSMYMGLTIGVLCQEHVYQGQKALAERESRGGFTANTYYEFWLQACKSERPERAAYLKVPERLTMPTLLISGTLDPITPEQTAEKALAYLPNAQHIIIPNAGHTNSGRGCMPRLMNEFLLTGEVADTQCITNNQFPAFSK